MHIRVEGAREHNLQDVDVDFGDGLTVVTGVSGSGKTSLVFDTLYHEARRRFLGIFARGSSDLRLTPAQVRAVTGIGPAVAVGQNLLNRNPNSTLATASGLHPFLRLLYARFGERLCAECGASLCVLREDEIVERLVGLSQHALVAVLAPLVQGVVGSHRTLLRFLADELGSYALHVDGRALGTAADPPALDPVLAHDVAVEVGLLGPDATAMQAREIVGSAAALGAPAVTARWESQSGSVEITLSRASSCVRCGAWFGDLEPVHFHTPCPHCAGEGCDRCAATGLHPAAAAVRWQGLRLPDLVACSVDEASARFAEAALPSSAARLLEEVGRRLDALRTVGLGYVTLDRPSPTLSRGEAQRVRLAIALTSRLEDMLHVLDEPTIGQHPSDVAKLMPAFRQLAGPVVYVEHDRAAAAVADRAIDLGPGAGSAGGRIVFSGTPSELWQQDTPTGRHFSLRQRVSRPRQRSEPEQFLRVRGANLRNLREVDVPIPLGRLTVITGVSGSGKSTFVEDVLVASLRGGTPAGCRALDGPVLKPVLVDQSPIGRNPRSNPATYTKVADVIRDSFAAATGLSASHFSFNRPDGACPTCKGMGAVEVAMRYLPSTWLLCADCSGQRFSDEVLAARAPFGDTELTIAEFYDLSVSDALALFRHEDRLPDGSLHTARRILRALVEVGLGYLSLGQPSPTLSGGEAQRVKLAKYLGRRSLDERLLVLDEPSTGLHPQDIAGLLIVLDRLVRAGATIVVVEHSTDVIRAADWVVDLGPGAGPEGGRVLYAGGLAGLAHVEHSLTAEALREEDQIVPRPLDPVATQGGSRAIEVRGARAHNLKGVDVDFPKGALTVVTGVSGSGKSSLVKDVLEAEARRRYLETLSMYERQSTSEGPEAPVDSVGGLGVAITVDPGRQRYSRRATVGTATEIAHHLAVLLAFIGERACPECQGPMRRRRTPRSEGIWQCDACGVTRPLAAPRHFSPSTYAAACLTCNGVGTLQIPSPDKLIVHPDKPLCGGAMHSPGFFPQGYLCKPYNYGYSIVRAVGQRYGFDPTTTPWNQMTGEARQAFLFGDPEPLLVEHESRKLGSQERLQTYPGFYGWIRDWDVGGTFTDAQACPDCGGARLRPDYLAVTLGGHNLHELSQMTLSKLAQVVDALPENPSDNLTGSEQQLVAPGHATISNRLRFLVQVGLGYLHLDRVSATLSAGEAQRIKLAGLLGSGLTSLTLLLDEPSRGLHPSEVGALANALHDLRDAGNTVIVVEHDPVLIGAADHLIELGPGPGVAGGEVVAQGSPEEVAWSDAPTARWLRRERPARPVPKRAERKARGWLTIRGASAHNLRGETVRLPLGALTGVCGVSGSGKSTLIVDTLSRALATRKQTTSVAYEPVAPGAHESIEGAPARTIVVDQVRRGVSSPANFLGLNGPLADLYAGSEDAQALGIDRERLTRRCSVCGGEGLIRTDLGFLPDVHAPCDTCHGTGLLPEAWDIRLRGLALPELQGLTIDEVHGLWSDEEKLARPLQAARDVGLGYLVLRQPSHALSGGEAQRLKIAKELCRTARRDTLYILDEPTLGQHLDDVARLNGVLHRLVDEGHTVVVVEHHPHLLAACDWLVELGPGGGPDGGRIVASGPPDLVAGGATPTAAYIREVLEAQV